MLVDRSSIFIYFIFFENIPLLLWNGVPLTFKVLAHCNIYICMFSKLSYKHTLVVILYFIARSIGNVVIIHYLLFFFTLNSIFQGFMEALEQIQEAYTKLREQKSKFSHQNQGKSNFLVFVLENLTQVIGNRLSDFFCHLLKNVFFAERTRSVTCSKLDFKRFTHLSDRRRTRSQSSRSSSPVTFVANFLKGTSFVLYGFIAFRSKERFVSNIFLIHISYFYCIYLFIFEIFFIFLFSFEMIQIEKNVIYWEGQICLEVHVQKH